ncbi:hypothetical protein [Roseobacter sp.]|uniref:hypothetical protein n=1 Tax=Roseobacter sp. TaxID=1907202 RepID=UPI0029674FE7|nr:hypothetical protein [Roseobacter sp.]MDW3181766.1 hypothetical protein [Roseobacter sp.]
MCSAPKVDTTPAPTVRRIAAPENDAVQRESELESSIRRRRSGVAADILTTPLGIVT